MKIYSDVLTQADLYRELAKVDPLLDFASFDVIANPRTTRHGYVVHLEYLGERSKGRRWVNSGTHGAGPHLSATWDEHGIWMAALYAIDPNARISYYSSRDDFMTQTAAAMKWDRKPGKAPWLKVATWHGRALDGAEVQQIAPAPLQDGRRRTAIVELRDGCLVLAVLPADVQPGAVVDLEPAQVLRELAA